MEIQPINEVRLYKGVPFLVDYANIVQFDNLQAQQDYFNSLTHKDYNNLTYTRNSGEIVVDGNRESLLDYNYMSFTNKNYGNKTFYAFITNIQYSSSNSSKVLFVVDEWQTWCFDIRFMPTFIERQHCVRWSATGEPVLNTIPEDLEFGSEYVTKDHQQYNNDVYWLCLATSLETGDELQRLDVPNPLTLMYLPIYHTTNNIIVSAYLIRPGIGTTDLINPRALFTLFRNSTEYRGKLVSAYLVNEPPFDYTWAIDSNNRLSINIVDQSTFGIVSFGSECAITFTSTKMIHTPVHSFPKYGKLKEGITESKLLFYPYSYIQLVDGQGNNFIIKPEYLFDTSINIKTFTSNGLNSKQAHIVENYRYKGVTLNNCRWELQNGIINNNANNLTIVDDYTASYLQGHANTIQQQISAVEQQTDLSYKIAHRQANVDKGVGVVRGMSDIVGGAFDLGRGGMFGSTFRGVADISNSIAIAENNERNVRQQGELNNQLAIASANAKLQDAKMVADNVKLQGGDVFFTFQNQFQGYCLVYRQISDEYIRNLQDYFQKYGYKVNRVAIPNLHTRRSWNYIRTIGCNLTGSINNNSLEILKGIFNNGTTIWHTTDVGNYTLNNDEI